MAVTNGYIGLEELKTALEIDGDNRDATLERAIGAASRQIDRHTERVFYKTESETRQYESNCPNLLVVDDLLELTGLETDTDGDLQYEDIWGETDWYLTRENPSTPYTSIATTPLGLYTFPRGKKAIQVTGDWGWEAPPDEVVQATLLLALRLFQRKDAPFGIVGSGELGQMRAVVSMDPDVKSLLAPYRRLDHPNRV